MKIAKIAKNAYVETKEMKVANDLGLDESDLESIRSKLVKEDSKIEDLPYIHIDTCVPYTLSIKDLSTDGKPSIGSLLFLCTSKDIDNMFLIMHNYIIEDTQDFANLSNKCYFCTNNRISDMLVYNTLANLDIYNSDFEMFTIDKDDENAKDGDVFHTVGYLKKKDGSGKIVNMYMDQSVANTILYTDDYILNGYYDNTSNIEIVLSSEYNSNKYGKPIYADNIKQVSYITKDKYTSKTYYAVFKIDNPFAKNETDKDLTVVIPVYSDKKLRTTLDYTSLDKYLSSMTYSYTCTIYDKVYTAIKYSNKDTSNMIYMDEDTINKLYDMIQMEFGK